MTTVRIAPEVLADMLGWPLLARYGMKAPFRIQVLADGSVVVSDEPLPPSGKAPPKPPGKAMVPLSVAKEGRS